MNEEYINSAVFYVKKQLDNSTLFESAVLLKPMHDTHRHAYSFAVSLCGDLVVSKTVTSDFDTAERIFDRIVCEKPSTWELEGFIKRLI